jgi:signal peptidase I
MTDDSSHPGHDGPADTTSTPGADARPAAEHPAATHPAEGHHDAPAEMHFESAPEAIDPSEPAPSEFDVPGLNGLEPAVAFEPPDTHHPPQQEMQFSHIADELWAWLKTLMSAAVYATLIVTFGFQVARVEGQSMAPTLEDQDRLIVNKLHYRLDAPVVGDIVMLYYPRDPDKSFVKRVIGEPGDTIRVEDGRVFRNDVPMRDDFIADEYRSHDDWGPEVIPEGYYFVMGDHRNNSSDSRAWGFVPKKYIIGKVQLRWWPIKQARMF